MSKVDDEYMVNDSDLQITKYISVPRDMGGFHPSAFVAGIIKGILEASKFPARSLFLTVFYPIHSIESPLTSSKYLANHLNIRPPF